MPAHVLTPAGRAALARIEQLGGLCEQRLLTRAAFRAQALQALAGGLGCDRISLWDYVIAGRRGRRLQCAALHADGAPPAAAAVIEEADHPLYFEALDRAGFLCAPDAPAHPALASMRDGYLLPQDIRSLLDVPFALNGRRVGLLCAEQTGRAIDWQPPQIALMRRAGIVGSRLMHRLAASGMTDEDG